MQAQTTCKRVCKLTQPSYIMYKPLITITKNLLRRDLRTVSGPLFAEKCINRVEILGRVGGDARVHNIDDQRHLVFFDVVTKETIKRQQEDNSMEEFEKDTWHSFVVRRPGLKEYVVQRLVKGCRVLCGGSVNTWSVFTDDGRSRKSSNIVLHDIVIMDDKRNVRPEEMEDELEIE